MPVTTFGTQQEKTNDERKKKKKIKEQKDKGEKRAAGNGERGAFGGIQWKRSSRKTIRRVPKKQRRSKARERKSTLKNEGYQVGRPGLGRKPHT